MGRSFLSRRQFIAGSAAAATACASMSGSGAEGEGETTVGLIPSSTYPEQHAALSVSDPSRIRLLQLTDIHFFCKREDPARDKQTLEDIPRLIERSHPDLLLISGDLWHDNPQGQGQAFMEFALEQVGSWGVPWLFTWGNHDQLDNYAGGHDALHEARHSLYRGGASGGNYVVALHDKTGAPLWDLVCLNSTELGVQAAQQSWLAGLSAETPPRRAAHAFAVFHIPLAQYATVWDEAGTSGICLEAVCAEKEDGSTLAALQQKGNIRACFCGHDHVNDYHGMAGGIELHYGRATGHGGYGGDKMPKGGKIITANAQSGRFTVESILADGSTWCSDPGKKIDTVEALPWH
jgi:3',5'-cyclic AMP phosphodiesterase CpdA